MVEQGEIMDLAPGHCVAVHLYWHSWNIGSSALKNSPIT